MLLCLCLNITYDQIPTDAHKLANPDLMPETLPRRKLQNHKLINDSNLSLHEI